MLAMRMAAQYRGPIIGARVKFIERPYTGHEAARSARGRRVETEPAAGILRAFFPHAEALIAVGEGQASRCALHVGKTAASPTDRSSHPSKNRLAGCDWEKVL
jgi:hypothetical protein